MFNNGTPYADHLFYTLKIRVGTWAKELLGLDLLSSNALANVVGDPHISLQDCIYISSGAVSVQWRFFFFYFGVDWASLV